jgi:Spy/CpxP family protein refolding chaperone
MISFSFVASAQTARPKLSEDQKNDLKAKMEVYKAELNLTAEQQPKFEEINLQFAEALAKLKEDNGSKISKYRKLKAATSERNKKVKDILTAEQYKVFQAHQNDMKEELQSRRKKN